MAGNVCFYRHIGPATSPLRESAKCQKQTSTAPRKILWITKDGVAPHPVDGAKIG